MNIKNAFVIIFLWISYCDWDYIDITINIAFV